jgi:hypothetical protein
MAGGGDYLGLDRIISIILLIIPFTAWLFGVLQRFKDGAILCALVRCFFGFNIIWFCDIVLTILNGCNVKILRVLQM